MIHGHLHREEKGNFYDCEFASRYYENFDKINNGDNFIAYTQPAIEGKCMLWHKNGKLHREDKINQFTFPAIYDRIFNCKEWYKNGKHHRDDLDENGKTLPAYISDNLQEWWKYGKLHRDDKEDGFTLPAVIGNDEHEEWWNNGKRHREDRNSLGDLLPAIEKYVLLKECWIDGKKIN